MKKKTYHSPCINLRHLPKETLLAASGLADPTSVNGDTSAEVITTGYAASKTHYSIWEEEYDEH